MQTILGSGGEIGKLLASELRKYTGEIRLVSRNPRKVNEDDHLFPADLTSFKRVREAIRGSEVVYLTAGLAYKTKVWEVEWPSIMDNVIKGCVEHGARLVFFDNIYMIDPDHLGHITEDSPIKPSSRKGKVRAKLDRMILDEVEHGNLKAIIARSADFFGPLEKNAVVNEMVYKNLSKGKKAQWFCNADVRHSLTFVPDAAKATAILGNTPDAFNQVWNMPTHPVPLTGREWIGLFAREMERESDVQVISKSMMRMVSLFVPVIREFLELSYQYEREYIFDSSKFNRRFGYVPVTPEEGVKLTVAGLKR